MPYHAYESVSATSAVKTVSVLSIPSNADKIEIQATTGPIRYTVDGATNPSQTSGMILYASDRPTAISPERLRLLRFCRGSGSDATLSLHYRGKDRTPTYPLDEESHSSQSSISTSSSSLSTSSSSKSTSSSSRSSLSTSSSSWSSVSTSSSSQSDVAVGHGLLIKTPYSYCTRADADFAGLNYSASDFSVELTAYLPPGGMVGSVGELMRHGQAECAYNVNRPGWSINAGSYGYSETGGWGLTASVIGGTQQATCSPYQVYTGTVHVVMTYKRSTGSIKLYVNGSLVASSANSSVAMPSSIGGTLTIGGANKVSATNTPGVGGYAMPEFNMHYARLWNGELTSTNVSDLYTRWNGTNRTDLPSGITATLVSAWYMNSQVGSKTGAFGTGWLTDAVGSNHLQIVDTLAITGGTQASLVAPSGSVSISSPSNGATSVSGATIVRATGLYGSNSYMQYYIEADTANTFNTANLRNSGWLASDGRWQPGFAPSTTYYLRVKARNGDNTGSESSWSSTVSFTTRAAATYYARPRTTAGTYGTEDGSSYANAFNGARHNGDTSGLQANLLKAQCDLRNVAPGDTVYLCDNWGLRTGTSTTLLGTFPERQWLTGNGLSGNPINIRLDHGTYPGSIYKCYKYTGSITWTSEGSGVYSSPTYLAGVNFIGVDDGTGKPTTGGSGTTQSLLINDATLLPASPGFYYSSGKIYVKTPAGTNPGNDLWYFTGAVGTFSLLPVGSTHIHFWGGSWFGTSPQDDLVSNSPSTYVTCKNGLYKYSLGEACFSVANYVDNWTLESCEIGFAANGVYGWDTPYGAAGLTGDNWTVTNCWIHDIGSGGWTHSDAHCVGWQNGSGWIVEDCLLQRSGSAVTQWGYAGKQSKNNIVRRNVITDVGTRNITFGAGISFENGNSTYGDRSGNQIYDNIIYNCDGPGIHYAPPDAVTITGNLIANVGLDPAIDNDLGNGISLVSVPASQIARATITDNVVVNPRYRYVRVAGNGTLTYLTINRNVYFTESESSTTPSKFQCAGYLSGAASTFVQWQAGLTFDQLSTWGDPETGPLPAAFDSMGVDFFLGLAVGDVNGDGAVNSTDLSVMQADAGAPRLALERYLSLLI